MSTLLRLGGSLGVLALAYLLIILGLLSGRLGAVLNMPPKHRWFYLGAGLVAVAWLAYVALVGLAADPRLAATLDSATAQTLLLAFYHLPLAVGLTIGLVIAWRYWSWLLRQG